MVNGNGAATYTFTAATIAAGGKNQGQCVSYVEHHSAHGKNKQH